MNFDFIEMKVYPLIEPQTDHYHPFFGLFEARLHALTHPELSIYPKSLLTDYIKEGPFKSALAPYSW